VDDDEEGKAMGLLRKARGLLGVGVTWGALWAVIGAGVGAIIGIVDPSAWTFGNPIVEWALGIGAYGLVSGVCFGGLLVLGEGRKTLHDLALGRVAVWGVLGAAFVPPLFGLLGTFPAGTTLLDVLGAVGVTAFLGGAFASSSVAIARRAALEAGDRPEVLGAGSFFDD
jgi:hypothetical protein